MAGYPDLERTVPPGNRRGLVHLAWRPLQPACAIRGNACTSAHTNRNPGTVTKNQSAQLSHGQLGAASCGPCPGRRLVGCHLGLSRFDANANNDQVHDLLQAFSQVEGETLFTP